MRWIVCSNNDALVLSFHGKNLNDDERHGGEKVMFDERDAPRRTVAKNLILNENALSRGTIWRDMYFNMIKL